MTKQEETKVQQDLVQKLQTLAANNKAFNAVCHVFALRQRTRAQVSVSSLRATMEKEGFNFPQKAYEDVVVGMSQLGIGTLVRNKVGRPIAITDIKLTLQSIGKAAISNKTNIEPRKQQNRFYDIAPVAAEKLHKEEFIEKQPAVNPNPLPIRRSAPYPTFLTVLIEGKPVNFSGPTNLTADNLAEFLGTFNRVVKQDKGSDV